MPTTIQQVESLPEELLETVSPKTPLLEAVVAECPPLEPELFETKRHVINCSDKFAKLTMEVNIVKDSQVSINQRYFIMTVHDLGFDNGQFDEFISCQHMEGIRNRTVWLNVNLPGQEIEASDLPLTKYPTLEELADELVTVLDYFKLPQVVLFGEGVGATIGTHFAMKYPNKCYGLLLVEPIVSAASYLESLKYKLQNFSFMSKHELNGKEKADALIQEASPGNENESFHLQPAEANTHEKFKNRNLKNLSLFAEAFLNRTNLIGNIVKLKVDALIVTNRNSSNYAESKKLFRSIQENNKNNLRSLVNTPFIEVEIGANSEKILEKCADQIALSFQYFLQGIGLLSAMPLKMSLVRTGSVCSQAGISLTIDESSAAPVDQVAEAKDTPEASTTLTE